MITKEDFITQYVIQFMASFSATAYCKGSDQNGHGYLARDAEYFAQEAWTEYRTFLDSSKLDKLV